jgi:glucosylceramidase
LKHPRAYNYGTLVWERKHLAAYALYFVKFVQAYAREGVRIAQIHPQNEVVADQKFPSCLWTGAQLRDFIRDHLGPAFARAGLNCEIWLGTLNTDDYNAFPFTVLSDPRANSYVAGVGFQWAGKAAIQRTHAAWPEKRLMQTENECGDGLNTWAYAHYVFGLIQHYISNGANAYVYWNMVLPEGGLSTWGWRQNSMITVDIKRQRLTYRPEFYVMRHLGQFVEPGAHRMGLAGTWAGIAVAFRNPRGSTVIVMHNPFADARPVMISSGAAACRAELQPMSFNTFVLP